jgi:hypothetical protein
VRITVRRRKELVRDGRHEDLSEKGDIGNKERGRKEGGKTREEKN